MRGAGHLRLRAVVEAPTFLPDGAGGAAETWSAVAAISVALEPARVAATERFDAREAVATHRVRCRFRDDVERGMRLAIGARRLAILAVHDPEERGRFLELRCREEL